MDRSIPLAALFVRPGNLSVGLGFPDEFVEFLGDESPLGSYLVADKFDEKLVFLNGAYVTYLFHSLLLTE